MKLSNSQIDKIGDQIRLNTSQIDESLLEQLQSFRVSHKKALSNVFNVVCEKSAPIRKASIVTYRIKRIDSIIRKLDRLKNQRLNRMWDIGGCRCILKNDDQVYKLEKELSKVFKIRKRNDYISNPQDSGYKSLHLYIENPDDNKIVEIQLRNQNDHNWATLVEISDVIFDAGLKEYGRDKQLERFHFLLSKKRNLTVKEMEEVAKILDDYDYIDRLSAVFARNNKNVRQQWMQIISNSNHKFFLIQSDKDNVPDIQSFENFNDSEKAYFEKYLTKNNSNLLLTHLPTPNYDKISVAYSNYLLTTHEFMSECYFILRSLIKKSLLSQELYKSLKYLNLYYNVNYNYSKNLLSEVYDSIDYKSSKKKKSKRSKKEKAWDRTLKNRIKQISTETQRFRKAMDNVIIESNLKRLVLSFGISYLNNKYDKSLKALFRD